MKLWYEYPSLANRSELYELVKNGFTVDEVAAKVGCSRKAVQTALKNQGLGRPIVVRIGDEMKRRLRL